ncbi:hypothetical protein F7734_45710 [Scytonema sp. UIC 10036]|uniref:hypothetical protein n=1 Tax=Scytonema sp. UIC 10036 TaxID=2304196 RepID=UPI0012DA9D54|nr:hypothetical protein [Scytonema sp. UIC 10036]MUG99205.1 hypothetical protein [Scytonema sp. UIC 10036]
MLQARSDMLPGHLRDSFIYVHDTLESCKTVAESIFGKGNYTANDVYANLSIRYRARRTTISGRVRRLRFSETASILRAYKNLRKFVLDFLNCLQISFTFVVGSDTTK